MNAQLAGLMDEIGLQILIDEFVGKVHYRPDISQLPRYSDALRWTNARAMYPPPKDITPTFQSKEAHPHYDFENFSFISPGTTPFVEDQLVRASLFRTREPFRGTVVIAHGGFLGAQPKGADLRPYVRWAIALARQGLHVVLPALPRHLDRAPAGTFSGERFLSGNLLETIDVIGQAVAELEALIRWLVQANYGPIGLMGMSLGGLTAVQLLSVSQEIRAALLLAPVPNAPRSLFESPIGRTIRVDWEEGGATRADLEAVFEPLSPRWRRPLLPTDRVRLAGGIHDQVVLPEDIHGAGHQWGAEVWDVPESHLGLISSNPLREKGSRWFAEQLSS